MPKQQQKKKKKGKRKREREGAPVQDERFAHIHHDPRFTRIPSKKVRAASLAAALPLPPAAASAAERSR